MTTTTFESVDGRMTNPSGDVRAVKLVLTIRELRGSSGVEDCSVVSHRLVTGNVPDGNYMLEYFCVKAYHERATVKHGALVSASEG
jgi:hypothetical protein